MSDRHKKAAEAIERAIEDEGPHPDYHWDLMGRHRAEWPVLWKAIDALVDALHAPKGHE